MASDGFLLGRVIDPAGGGETGEDVVYDPSDLTTHGVIVGMTGSGKTGLGVVVLEEALRAGLPALIIDPKGDMGNLLLMFPEFRPTDFAPWVIPESEAGRDKLAADTAELWKKGVSGWDPGLEAIKNLKNGVGFTIYTPGSTAGVPVNIVGNLDAPALSWDTEAEALRDEIEGFVSSLLTLAGIESDPISSREHILLANLIENSWRQGRGLDMASLIGQVQAPPIRKLGVFEVDAFFPEKDRTALAMRLNGLVASPSFASWMEGPPLDVQAMLFTPEREPRAAVVYLAHLSDEERQFVVTLLLSKVVTWMRGLAGTPELRALIYMDEVFGFAPPTAAPPSKKPILTILKQARAFGVGLLLSTQNPVDLDYKAMSNAGTWMVGRLQTERDKARILEALQSAAGGTDVASLDKMISGLGKRQFVLHNTHEKGPRILTTRWAMSYLRGPLTREEITTLTAGDPQRAIATPPASGTGTAPAGQPTAADQTVVAPLVAKGVPVYYLDPAAAWADQVNAIPGGLRLQAAIAARVSLLFDDTRAGVDQREEWEAVFVSPGRTLDPEQARAVDYDARDFRSEPPAGATYALPEAPIADPAYFKDAADAIKEHLYRNQTVEVFANRKLKLFSRIGETRDEFAARCDAAAQDEEDREAARLHDKYGPRIAKAKDTADAARLESVGEIAGSLLGGLLGGRSRTRSLSRAGGKLARSGTAGQEMARLEAQLADELAAIDAKWAQAADDIETLEIGLEKTDITVDEVALVWAPTG